MPDTQSLPQRRYLAGVLALLAVVFIWVASSFVMNNIFADLEYNKPFLITYLNTATFSLYLLPFLFSSPQKTSKGYSTENSELETQARLLEDHLSIEEEPEEKLSTIETIQLSFAFCLLWFLANYTTNASLAYTSVASSTILSSMSGLFTLGIGALFRVEQLNWIKVVAVCLSFLGVIFVSHSDQLTNQASEMTKPLIGDLLALCGAFFYGCYTTLLKMKIGDESRINMPLFFGFVGAFNVLLMWPFFLPLHFFGIESFELPYSSSLWFMVILNAFVGTFLSDYLWLLAMLMTTPLAVTLGISLTIPLALVGDVVFKRFVPGIQYALGAALVVAGFFIVNMATLSEIEKRESSHVIHEDDEPHRAARALSVSESR
ncbi:hypothetical protein EDC96DRAFT_527187 [Choanephora cucurbitarum]|nr:hypothetical protein EDC96DRAFT_527187 [Choanephora cucurbitarum]